ncbi:MAG: hypothetical protein QM765_44340 [Myxococcales bacterium]
MMLLAQASAMETVPGRAFEKGDKPEGLMPEHRRVSVEGFGKLDVVDLAAWERHFAAEPKVAGQCVTKPAGDLKNALKGEGVPKDSPLLGCPDAVAPFTVQARRVKAGKVEGFLFVTEHFIEDVLPSNQGLTALFQGVSADGKTYVVGSVKVKAKGLRDEPGDLQKDAAAYKKQLAADAAMLGKLGPEDFEPNLDTLSAALGKAQL